MKEEYFLVIARLVPENNIDMIVEAFEKADTGMKLIITGSYDDNRFARKIHQRKNSRIIFTGALYEKNIIDALRFYCRSYIHGHSVGGTNPSLIEAMAAQCVCICHDNIYNREVTAGSQLYFKDVSGLKKTVEDISSPAFSTVSLKKYAYQRAINFYTWEKTGEEYLELFKRLLNGRREYIFFYKDKDYAPLAKLGATTYAGRELSEAEYLHWEYEKNPSGQALICAFSDDFKISAQYVALPLQYFVNGKCISGSLSVNTLTAPAYRGRRLFPLLAEKIYEECRRKNIQFTAGFPNSKSVKTFIGALKFSLTGELPLLIKPLRIFSPLISVIRNRNRKSGDEINIELESTFRNKNISRFDFSADAAAYSEFSDKFIRRNYASTGRSLSYLKWRYADIPLRKYFILKQIEGDEISAIAVLRFKFIYGLRCCIVIDFVTTGGDESGLQMMKEINSAARFNKMDMVVTSLPVSTHEYKAARVAGFMHVPERLKPQPMPFIIRLHDDPAAPDLLDFRKWFLTFGDYDIF